MDSAVAHGLEARTAAADVHVQWDLRLPSRQDGEPLRWQVLNVQVQRYLLSRGDCAAA